VVENKGVTKYRVNANGTNILNQQIQRNRQGLTIQSQEI